ncbi:MAG: type IV pilus twitching motility protein PilT [Aureliella sp.]
MQNDITSWLEMAVQRGASDLHLVAGYPPTLRLHGELTQLDSPALSSDALLATLLGLCDDDSGAEFKRLHNVDFALSHTIADPTTGEQTEHRCRANYFMTGEGPGACFRIIPNRIPDFGWTGFPERLAGRLAGFRDGLVLLTGMTGAGKSTSLAMIVNLLNQQGGRRIVTIEDPIEYRYQPVGSSIVTQREIGRDVDSFAEGLRYGLRQDPDVILVGEIRDYETAQMALSAAETGHLVLSTLHTRDAKGAISRFADLFPQSSQPEVRSQLAMGLRAVVSQALLPCAFEDKRQLALEIMFNTHSIAAGIRTGKLETIDTGITTGRGDGMISLDESIKRLLSEHCISRETALRYVTSPELLGR